MPVSWANLPRGILSRIFQFLPNWFNGVHRVLLTQVCKHWYDEGIYVCWKNLEIYGLVNTIKLNKIAFARPDLAAMTTELEIYNVKWYEFSEEHWMSIPPKEKGSAANFVWPDFYCFSWTPNCGVIVCMGVNE
ncbi:uncharacterized protein MELLADRAFT_112454 [Melampsora larici-populina 98AG31]|uniref:F-box domain-containing protein n=1 Tax=Melampsora larici-populina (strain 98AG31 / pathotype 3-4-7) TaxID=747676 RepID=F4S6J0_MELLP|nr:uncharacterized protein MELLADRAFT_112454 [Melampsora larici-populina 98AG31]EGF99750.1 hypothetical protein MELLADRAFT_112454 [Melampsora larici-populina 98AG31]